MYFYVAINREELVCRLKVLENNLAGLHVERLDVVKRKEVRG